MNYSFRKDNDWLLIGATIILALFGLLMVYSASYVEGYLRFENSYYYVIRQGMWLGLSSVAFIVLMHFQYRHFQKITPLIIFMSIVLLILVKLIGLGEDVGSSRWIRIGPVGLQPSEFVKLGLIIYLAHVYSRKQAYIDDFVNGVMPPLIIVGVMFGLIMLQPDLGTATSIMLTAIMLVVISGAKWRHLIGLVIVGGLVFAALAVFEPYRLRRLVSFADPFANPDGAGFQLIHGYLAISNGGFTGLGLGESMQKLRNLPEGHTDFILTIISEELGFLGIAIVFLCYGIILFRGVSIGTKCKNPFGSLLAFGIVFSLAIQIIFNVGAVSGMLPITGVTLPLVSYGGTSLLVTLMSVAILANIHQNNERLKRKQMDEGESLSA
ncbi:MULTISPECIES: putative lipid II flippase FtsW [Shouchella]|uniref:Probable peptidoglycan glycosyltransferase FtsW n=2 Tax=Shouchella TaxID=2893057 RepID=A0ABY7W758_9BACI|nr:MULTISPECIES: putative lipid II flippase FtsW [Shouchella]MED4130381.1 putative lipid II flippase FtsW [Shouchella miscanthi]WDF04269.1 putative lipid II flippase FtsW [Shouchella hunanensis]GAF21215.1 cell division protein FtsW [Bacillus sp. JCM 19047]